MSRHSVLLCILVLEIIIASTASLSILLVQSVTTTSHHIWMSTLVKGLLSKGHHVHVASIHETKIEDDLAQNLTYTVFDNVMKELRESDNHDPVEWMDYSVFYMSYFTYYWSTSTCEKITQTKGAKELLELVRNNKFDVIVQDVSLHQCLYGLWEIPKHKTPVVGLVVLSCAPWLKYYVGGPSYPNLRPFMNAAVAKPMTIWQRTLNVLYYAVDDIFWQYYYLPASQRLAEQYVGQDIRPLHEIEKNISVVLINSYFVFDGGIPLPPNAIEIGGLHAQKQAGSETNAGSESMHKFLDEAENGAVVISLGTNVDWKHVGLEKLKIIISALAKLKQRIIWKLDVSVTMPDNIMAVKWFSQNAILSHKNVKAIWTHGGLLSTQEAVWNGIPLIGMPFFLDQKYNVENMVAKGVALRLDFDTLSIKSVSSTLEEIIYNKSYTENMKRLSSEYRDRPLPPLDLAIWSIEYAARNPNTNLASPIKFQSWMEQNLIDIYAILILSLFVLILICVFATKILYNYLFKSSVTKHKQM